MWPPPRWDPGRFPQLTLDCCCCTGQISRCHVRLRTACFWRQCFVQSICVLFPNDVRILCKSRKIMYVHTQSLHLLSLRGPKVPCRSWCPLSVSVSERGRHRPLPPTGLACRRTEVTARAALPRHHIHKSHPPHLSPSPGWRFGLEKIVPQTDGPNWSVLVLKARSQTPSPGSHLVCGSCPRGGHGPPMGSHGGRCASPFGVWRWPCPCSPAVVGAIPWVPRATNAGRPRRRSAPRGSHLLSAPRLPTHTGFPNLWSIQAYFLQNSEP